MGKDVYQVITDQIISLIESEGLLPWQKGWAGSAAEPKNFKSQKPYRGINPLILSISGFKRGFSCPYWLTFKQAKELKGKVLKGSKGTQVIFWNWIEKEDAEGEKDFIPFLRYYTVFNLEQIENIEWEAPEENKLDPIEAAKVIVDNMPLKPEIVHGQSGAFYSPLTDSVGMPNMGCFKASESYYTTLFHELTHSTGADHRLKRHKKEKCSHRFGSKDYSKEELVAEIGAAYLSNSAGIVNKTIENSAAYLKGWLSKLKNDKRLLIQAASAAQKATDFILNKTI